MIITLLELLTQIAVTAVCMFAAGFITGYCVAAMHFTHRKKGRR